MLRRLLIMFGLLKQDMASTRADLATVKSRTEADLKRLEDEVRRDQQTMRTFEAELEVYRKRNSPPTV